MDFWILLAALLTASVNQTLAILRHAINWGRGRTPPIFTTSPFHKFGVKIKPKGEVKRDRRITHGHEQRLLAAADKLNCAEHAFAGALMRDRIIRALETGCRLGEMLNIQNRHVLWNTHGIVRRHRAMTSGPPKASAITDRHSSTFAHACRYAIGCRHHHVASRTLIANHRLVC